MNITKTLKISVVGIGGGGCVIGSLKAISQEFKDSNYRLNFILTTPFKWEGVKKNERANKLFIFRYNIL